MGALSPRCCLPLPSHTPRRGRAPSPASRRALQASARRGRRAALLAGCPGEAAAPGTLFAAPLPDPRSIARPRNCSTAGGGGRDGRAPAPAPRRAPAVGSGGGRARGAAGTRPQASSSLTLCAAGGGVSAEGPRCGSGESPPPAPALGPRTNPAGRGNRPEGEVVPPIAPHIPSRSASARPPPGSRSPPPAPGCWALAGSFPARLALVRSVAVCRGEAPSPRQPAGEVRWVGAARKGGSLSAASPKIHQRAASREEFGTGQARLGCLRSRDAAVLSAALQLGGTELTPPLPPPPPLADPVQRQQH
ncbi:skin secretory protein xP2-like [Dryobates pubescens]|uniref:skin secretory protein xP2-like n=1 Tax=Dryobates pubescens TaxID=118200 RepID=UPI0023B8DD59|nr:skin secretory protein xP2-like [Dryobates pubescens]